MSTEGETLYSEWTSNIRLKQTRFIRCKSKPPSTAIFKKVCCFDMSASGFDTIPSTLLFSMSKRTAPPFFNPRPLFGMDVKYTAEANAFYPLQVKTSIDRNIQKAIEDMIQKFCVLIRK
jgi:hypothetical protein